MEKKNKCGYTMFMRLKRSVFIWVIAFAILLGSAWSYGQVQAVEKDSLLLQQMTVEEKIGQLFLVTFKGKDISENSNIYQLINQYHIGGVLIRRENGNWRSGVGEASAVLQLSNGLQNIEASAGESQANAGFVPLFIAIAQPGNGYPYDQLATELTPLPSQMTIGATWLPENAKNAGEVLGRELSILGINMLFGPSLDVLERPNPGTTGDLGIQVFGGDPFWVWQMGKAYIQGVQEGSNRQIAVVATHFPGIGGSDRNPEEEVATVRKAMEDLRQIDLAPFAAVTNGIPGIDGIIDGLLVSHLRYQGLQGNIRATTRPVSMDPQALLQLMSLSEFKSWREADGITVSDSLGTQSVRKFYDPTGLTFSNRYIALNAFQAGNDILQLSDFSDPETGDEMQPITDTIRYFQQKYQTEEDFAALVDQAVLRILALKRRLYPVFSARNAQVDTEQLNLLGTNNQLSSAICKDGASLISPGLNANGELDLEPPSAADRILILTDSRQVVPCPGCAMEMDLSPTALSDTILRLYGPGASGFVESSRVSSYTFRDVYAYLQGTTSPDLDKSITNSTILVVLMRNPQPSIPESSAFQNLLAQRPEIVRKKKIIVFSLAAPYYLDSTEISKFDAYYALYSKTSPCIEAAARLLYREASPLGASPVSVEGVNYDLLTALSPDPTQMIEVTVTLAETVALNATPTSASTPTLTTTPRGYLQGDTLAITAGPVVDHNQHLVPDGTVIKFRIEYPNDKIPPLILEETTVGGIGQVDYLLERQGEIQITAYSEPAMNSTIIQLTTGLPPVFLTPNGTSTAETTPTEVPINTPGPASTPGPESGPIRSNLGSFGLMVLVLALFSGGGVAIASIVYPNAPRWKVLLGSLIGGLAGYDYIAIGMPGANWLSSIGGQWISVLFGGIGCGIGLAAVWLLILRKGEGEGVKRID